MTAKKLHFLTTVVVVLCCTTFTEAAYLAVWMLYSNPFSTDSLTQHVNWTCFKMFPLSPFILSTLCLKCSPAENREQCQTFGAFSADLHSTPGHSDTFPVQPGNHSIQMSSHLAPLTVSHWNWKSVTPFTLCDVRPYLHLLFWQCG